MSDPAAKVRKHTLLSLIDGEPTVGVYPTLPAWQIVRINAPIHEWSFRKVGKRRYHLSTGGYPYVGVIEAKIVASIYPVHNQDWIVTWAERQSGFLIESTKKPGFGWKVENDEIVFGALIATFSLPPVYPTNQLFRFKGLVGADLEKLPVEYDD